MTPSYVWMLLITSVICTQAENLFKKLHNKKVPSTQIASSHAVKGVLHCEKLCLAMGGACAAANMIDTNGRYVCEVMEVLSYSDAQLQDIMVHNPRGKLIVKQGMSCFNQTGNVYASYCLRKY